MKESKIIFVATASVGQPVRPHWWDALADAVTGRAVLFDTTMAIEHLDHPAMSRPVTKRSIVRGLGLLGLDVAAQATPGIPASFLGNLAFEDVTVVRDAIVLARSSLVVLDANHPSLGDNFVLASSARVLGIPVLVVSDRIVRNAWVSYLATAMVSSHGVGVVARQILSHVPRRSVDIPVIPVDVETPENDGQSGR